MVTRIDTTDEERPSAPASRREPFSKQRGKLRLPVRGELTGLFGAPRGAAGTEAKGVFIRAAEGQPVRAVASGPANPTFRSVVSRNERSAHIYIVQWWLRHTEKAHDLGRKWHVISAYRRIMLSGSRHCRKPHSRSYLTLVKALFQKFSSTKSTHNKIINLRHATVIAVKGAQRNLLRPIFCRTALHFYGLPLVRPGANGV